MRCTQPPEPRRPLSEDHWHTVLPMDTVLGRPGRSFGETIGRHMTEAPSTPT